MSNYRLSKDTTAHYTSLEELRSAYNFKPVSKRTKNQEKLAAQQERFLGKCKVCGTPLQYIPNTNVLVCPNENCTGIKVNDELTLSVNRVLDDKSAEIARTLFS